MPGGRPRKPAALHVLHGTARPDRQNAAAPVSKVLKVIDPPAHLTDGERAAWTALAAVVGPLQVATPADLVAFEQMACTLAVVTAARATINAEGLTYAIDTESGTVLRKRPEVEILIAFKRQLSAELARFGLTPAEREKVSAIGEDGAGDPLDEF